METNPKVSVVIPTYSRNDTLERAIASVLNQTYRNLEILVVDDNPADSEWRARTSDLMQKYAGNPMIRYIKNPCNMGGSGARNTGIREAIGAYIAFLDDDDEYLTENIEKKLHAFQQADNEKVALVYGYSEYVDGGRVVYTDKKNFNGCCIFDAMEQNCIAATSQWMVRKSALVDIGYFPIVPSKQDSQTMLKLLGAGYEIKCVPEVLSRYYMDFSTVAHISNNGRKPLQGELLYYEECRKYYSQFDQKQIARIEYTFAVMLYEKYTGIGDKRNAGIQKEKMYQLSFLKATRYFGRAFLRKVKAKLI